MPNYYRPRLTFIRANAVKRKMKVKTQNNKITEEIVAEAGDYVVVFPNGARTVLKKDFFESMYESAEDAVFCDICLDFDGVLHSYTSGWGGAAQIPDPPVDGAFEALRGYLAHNPPLVLAIYSARSSQADGIQSMYSWIDHHDAAIRRPDQEPLVDSLLFPYHKPAAKVYLDDRGVRFNGKFPSADELIRSFRVWNESEKRGKLYLPTS